MKKEELISSVIMCIVCVLVLVGFTIAWFTTGGSAVVTGLQVVAGEMSAVKISLTSKDSPEQFVDIEDKDATFVQQFAGLGMPEYTNVEVDVIGYTDKKDANGEVTATNVKVEAPELGPGTSGVITFYVLPDSDSLVFCDVSPRIALTESDINSEYIEWYSSDNIAECSSEDLKTAHGIALSHIKFYSDEAYSQEVTAPIRLSWETVASADRQTTEKAVTFYWKWDYEYAFTAEELNLLSAEDKKEMIDNYDEEDMFLGNHISSMKFEFVFVPQ